jgi:hypothetical protein
LALFGRNRPRGQCPLMGGEADMTKSGRYFRL